MLCFNNLTGEQNAKKYFKKFCFVGVYLLDLQYFKNDPFYIYFLQ